MIMEMRISMAVMRSDRLPYIWKSNGTASRFSIRLDPYSSTPYFHDELDCERRVMGIATFRSRSSNLSMLRIDIFTQIERWFVLSPNLVFSIL